MSNKSPYVTLAGAAGAFITLMGVNMATAPDDGSAPAAAVSTATASGPTGATSSPTPPPSTSVTSSEPPTGEATPTPTTTTPPPSFPHEAVYAGHTADSGPALAVAILGTRAAAYFCDGARAESWMTGWARDGKFSLTGKGKDAVTGRLHNDRIIGTTTVQSSTYNFRIRPVSAPAGLYRGTADGGATTIGWIVLPDGSQVGIANVDGSEVAAPTLDPGSNVRVNGESVVPHQVHSDEEL